VEIRLSDHVVTRLLSRGTSILEVEEVLAKGLPDTARGGRQAKYLIYPYGHRWGARTYEQKRVRVVYALQGDVAYVVTVYVYYGSWQ
jgi:hypothetical protein